MFEKYNVIIHIGLPRAGSKYLQRSVFPRDDRIAKYGFIFPPSSSKKERKAHLGLLGSLEHSDWSRQETERLALELLGRKVTLFPF